MVDPIHERAQTIILLEPYNFGVDCQILQTWPHCRSDSSECLERLREHVKTVLAEELPDVSDARRQDRRATWIEDHLVPPSFKF